MNTRTAWLLAGLIALGTIERVAADGTEGLGVPSIPIATGTGIAAGGRGLITQPGIITVTVPPGATIKQVLLYWEGFMLTDSPGDPTIRVSSGGPPVIVNGTLIGGQSFFFFNAWASTYRADITALGLVTPGLNNLTVDDLTFTEANNGAGVFVIYDDGGPPTQINVRDGNDLAFINFPDPRKDTIPQTFTFVSSSSDRVARLDMFFSSVAGVTSTGGPQRPNAIEITVAGTTTTYNNLLDSFAGEEWDYISLPVYVPGGITTVTVQAFSRDDLGVNELPASLDWIAAFFAIEVPAHIGDLVFNDLNANGIQDGGSEVGVDGVTVELFTCAGNLLTGTTVTAGGGLYGFDVIPGDYYVRFSNLPAGFVFSPSTPSGASDPNDSDANLATGVADCTTIVAGENDPTWDAGIYQPATIGDLVFNDLNANGNQDGGGEVGVDGVAVQLFTCVGDVLVSTTVTAGGGLYLFTVPAGDYYVKFSNLPAGFIFSPSTPGAASDPTDSDANPATGVADCTTLVAGETDLTWDAGIYQPPLPARIGDLVFNDLNANGIQDGGGEVGIDGVTVQLFACVGDVLVSTTVTAGGGLYLFTVPAGDYYVKFSNLPAGFVFSPSTPSAASDPADSDANPATGVADCTTLLADETDLTWDAGIYEPAKIGDLVFNDLNANGIQDGGGEVGIDGVTVQIFTCVGDVLMGTTVTAGGGLYLFTVPPGNYYVKFSNLPAGFVFSPSTPSAASDPADSDANPATGVADCTTLLAGETDLTWDAGIYQPAKIGDLVFNDLNANGVQDGGGEVGVDGVTVQLFTCVGDALMGTTVTAGGGLYLFTVPPGNYYVKFSNLPAGFVFSPSSPSGVSDPTDSDANPATGVADCTTLAPGETDLTWDAGIYSPAKIGDLVFNDLNANGNQDGGGEVGVDGVTVQLFNCVGDVLVATTVTAGGGLYLFTVPPGNYYVKFSNLPAGFVFSPSTPSVASDPTDSDANPATGVADCTTLTPGETDLTWDAGVYQPAKIGDLVFNDLNGNGNQDGGGEVGVDGITVQLFNCVGDVLVATTDTAGGGLYLFTVSPGNYYVKFSNLPAGFVFSPSTPSVASDPTDSDANPATGVADCTTLTPGETDLTWDAGVYQPAKIGDLVFNDLNANGIQDGGGEVGIDGVSVQLFTCVGDALMGTTVTAGGGLYLFTVPPGNYYVKFSNLPAGFVFSPSTPSGASDPTDSDANPATGITDCTTLTSGETDLTWDAGIYQPPKPARIGDLVFNDLNANGIQDGGGEVGIDGVTVQLFTCVGDVLMGTTVTAGGGLYLFTVPAGNYYVKFSNLPAGFVFSPSTPSGASDPTDSDANPATGVADCTTLVADETDLTWDAGIYQPAKIGDLVFNDLNANGIQDGGGEVGVDGVTVELYNCVGDVLVATTVTAGGGLYAFTVPPGNYYVKFSNLPAGFVFSPSTPSGASDPTDSDANPATGKADCTTLVAGENDLTWDAGVYQPAKIGDLVFNDLNANGIQDGGGEVGVNGVTVELYNCVGDVLVATTVTAGGGLYVFTVPPGNYYVKFGNLPAGFVFSPSTPSGASDPTDSDANPATGKADCTTLVAGENDLTWDAGVYQPAKIGDLVFNDLNANGIQDGGGEVGVDGVTVELYNCVGDVLVATTVTAGGGLYVFTVPPGNYYVKFGNLPAGFVFSPSTPGGASDPTDSDANPATGKADCTTLVAGENDLTWDAGVYQPAKIGDLVFNDLNANGIQDGGGEVGVDGVTVELYNCVGDVLVATTVTAGGGLYVFTVPPGNYYVKFGNLPAGFVFSPSTPSGASDPTDSDANPATGKADCTTLVAGENDLTWDAGVYQPAKIGDLVFNDLNANGIQDGGGEVGVDGVTVELYNCVGDVLVATTVTAGGGLYVFTVPPGNYYVKFGNLPAGFVFSPSTPGGASDPTDSDANPATGKADCTTLVAGENDLTWDAGVYQPAKIGDLVFNDLNANGIQDGGGEVGVDGVTVELYNCVGDVLVATTVTAGGGLYVFTVPPGNYYVKFGNLPAGFVFSPSTPGGASDPTDSDANPATGKADCTTLVAGENDLTWDAGVYQPAKIGDLVFNDLNANGVQDGGGEVGVNGVTVELYNCVGDVLVATTVTAGGGLYVFTVPPGNYYVKFVNLPAGFVFSPSTPSGASDPTDSDANPATGKADCTTLVAGENDLTWDAGVYQPAKIGDLVFNDLNANGIQDGGGEVGVDGVTVELYNCVGDVLVATTVTAGGGLYVFTVPPGNYYVKFGNLPAGFVFSPSTPGGASDPTDSDANPATGKADCTTLVAGENDLTWDAGVYQPAKIGDLVFNDLNANGVQDGGGEVGVNGVTVELYNCVGDVLVATTVTAGGGLYVFTVPPGNYYVKFVNLPAGFVFSPSTPSGASDPTDSDANPATGKADCTTLVAGEIDLTWDAGVYQPAKIGDLVFNDLNGNGNQDGGGEVGVDGVTVELYNCAGDVLVATTVTAGGGIYMFVVPPGNYYVKFVNLPAGFVFSPSTPSGASDPTDSDANPATGKTDCTTLTPGENDTTWDAGVYQPAKIGDLVFNDLNGNGNQDGGGEVGVDGVTVELYNCDGDVLVATTVTAGGGMYMFVVPPGTYYVKFSNLPAGYVFSPSTPSGASDPTDSDANPATGKTDCTTLTPGEIDFTWDAGVNLPNGCPIPPLPSLVVDKVCQNASGPGQPITFSGTVRNNGNVTLANVFLTDDKSGLLKIIPLLAPGESMPYTGQYTPVGCGNFTSTVTAIGTDAICSGRSVTNAASATCAVPCPGPCLVVIKEISCLQPQGCDVDFKKIATGVKPLDSTQCPAFCYRITITNCSATTPLRNITVTDNELNLSGCGFPTTLGVGESFTCIVPAVPHCESVTNTVTAVGQSLFNTETVTSRDSAIAVVKDIGLVCSKFVSSPDDEDGDPDNAVVQLPDDSNPHLLYFTVRVSNIGDTDLANVTITDTLLTNIGCILPMPFKLAAGATTNIQLCTVSATCANLPMTNNVVVRATVDTSSQEFCAYDQNGNPLTTGSECSAVVVCMMPGACRVTGGGKQTESLTFPAVSFVTHGGQVGAPVGRETEFDPDSECIHGNWQHVRHAKGKNGTRGNFHAKSYDSLMCACLGCPEDPTAVGIAGGLCNPGQRTCGPEPRRAPANKICFSGVGDYANGSGRRAARSVLFRVDIEDRGEPGGSHPGGGTAPADRYRIRIWILTATELARLRDPNDGLFDFRRAIAATKASAVIKDGAPGPLGSAVFGVRAPDVDDGGVLEKGNHQLHPQIKDCP